MKKYDLPNGIKVYCHPMPSSYSVVLGLYINVGVKDETEDNNGITHLLEHLHFRKLGDWEQEEIYHNMNKIGAVLNGSTYKELLKFSIKARPKFFFDCMEFFLRILSTYDWTESHLNDEKRIVLNELYSKEPYMSISPYVDEAVWGSSPLSRQILGKEENIKSITLKQLIDYKKRFFCRENIALVITGNISETDIETANEQIGKIKLCDSSAEGKSTAGYSKAISEENPNIQLIDCNWDYVDVNISFNVDNADINTASLLNSIIGGGIGAILPNIIREEYGLVYDIYSTLDLYNDKSVLNIIFSTEKQNIYKCLEKVVTVLNSTKRNITNKHIIENITYFTENSWYLLENSEILNEELGWKVFTENDPSFSIEKKISLYEKIDEQILMDFAKNVFVSKNAAAVVLGNTSQITKEAVKKIITRLDDKKTK